MSTTDRFEFFRGACLCGKGDVVIQECSPDHPWARPSQTWWETSVNCSNCDSQYEIRVDRRRVLAFSKADLVDKQRRVEAWDEKNREMQEFVKKQGYYTRMAALLNAIKVKSRIHKCIAGMYSTCSYPTFLKRFSGGLNTEAWLESALHTWRLADTVKDLLRVDDPVLRRLQKESDALAEAMRKDPKPIKELNL